MTLLARLAAAATAAAGFWLLYVAHRDTAADAAGLGFCCLAAAAVLALGQNRKS